MKLLNPQTRTTCARWLLCGLLLLCFQVQAQTRQLLNYQAIHKPVWGDRGMVVSQNEMASQIGAQVLRDGGNAVDAAVATAFAMAVVLPRAGNIGGDGFMLIHLAKENRTLAIDYRSAAPAAATLERYLGADGKLAGGQQAGYLAAGVPGTVAGLALAHRKYGRLPWSKLVQPAIALARDGVILSRDEAFALDWGKQRLSLSEAGAKVFLHPDGNALRAGERLLQSDLAWSLQQIAEHGEDAFYRGQIAQKLAAGMATQGGLITLDDLKAYRAIEREALIGSYRGHRVATMPPVSGGGASLLEMLNILEHVDLAKHGAGSAQALHYLAEAIKLAWTDRASFAGDPAFIKMPVKGLTSKAYAAERAKLISADKALALPQATGDPWQFESKETTHFSVVDTDGNAVSNTYTLGSDFGAGVMIEGTGFLLGNLIGNFSLADQLAARTDPKRKNANELAPGRRPVSSMSPTMLFKDDKVWMVTGSPGGNTIPGTVMQSIVNVVDFDMNIAEGSSVPRIHQDVRDGELQVERGISPDTLALLRQRGHKVVSDETIGSTQILMVDKAGVQGAADPRRPGAAAIAE